MGWNQVLECETSTSSQEDNPLTGLRSQSTGKISVKLPCDDWLCWKLEKLHLALTEGYPSLRH